METPQHGSPVIALINTIVSMISGTFALITINEIQKVSSLLATGVAMVSGFMATRYYYFVTKEKIQNLKRHDHKKLKPNP